MPSLFWALLLSCGPLGPIYMGPSARVGLNGLKIFWALYRPHMGFIGLRWPKRADRAIIGPHGPYGPLSPLSACGGHCVISGNHSDAQIEDEIAPLTKHGGEEKSAEMAGGLEHI